MKLKSLPSFFPSSETRTKMDSFHLTTFMEAHFISINLEPASASSAVDGHMDLMKSKGLQSICIIDCYFVLKRPEYFVLE